MLAMKLEWCGNITGQAIDNVYMNRYNAPLFHLCTAQGLIDYSLKCGRLNILERL